MEYNEKFALIECILFVSGDPVSIGALQRTLDVTAIEMQSVIKNMDELFRREQRGIQLYITEDTIQLVSNKIYASTVEEMLQPAQTKSFSQSALETLSIIAYKQPITRSEIEAVRGVRCEYSVSQLLKLDMIRELGRKDAVGRPMLFGTTDKFLRHFGLCSLCELPPLQELSESADDGIQPE